MRARSIPYLVHNRTEKLRSLLLGTLLFLGPDLGSSQMTEFTNVPDRPSRNKCLKINGNARTGWVLDKFLVQISFWHFRG